MEAVRGPEAALLDHMVVLVGNTTTNVSSHQHHAMPFHAILDHHNFIMRSSLRSLRVRKRAQALKEKEEVEVSVAL